MADKSKIEWTEATWNPVVGCSIVSPGCTYCYAMKMAARIEAMAIGQATKNGGAPGLAPTHYAGTTQPSKAGPVWTGKLALAPDDIVLKPLKWKRPRTIFVNSMGDLFHESVPDAWIDRVFAVMAMAKQHTFQVLTKRAKRMRAYFSERRENAIHGAIWSMLGTPIGSKIYHGGNWRAPLPLPNVWLGVSAEDQKRYDERIPHLLATPAAVRFVSAEPLLGPIDLERGGWSLIKPLRAPPRHWPRTEQIHWIIVGGESGPGARPMHPDWARSLRDQCQAAGVPYFFKQWGEWGNFTAGVPAETSGRFHNAEDRVFLPDGCVLGAGNGKDGLVDPKWRENNGAWMSRVGKRAAGRLLDGQEHNEMPERAS